MITAMKRGAHRELEAKRRPFIACRVSSACDIDDVVQEVFLRMQRSIATIRDEDRFGPWLYRVARNAIADHRRAIARQPVADGIEARNEAAECANGEDETAVERTLVVRRAVRRDAAVAPTAMR